jgi:hypothetical protein
MEVNYMFTLADEIGALQRSRSVYRGHFLFSSDERLSASPLCKMHASSISAEKAESSDKITKNIIFLPIFSHYNLVYVLRLLGRGFTAK